MARGYREDTILYGRTHIREQKVVKYNEDDFNPNFITALQSGDQVVLRIDKEFLAYLEQGQEDNWAAMKILQHYLGDAIEAKLAVGVQDVLSSGPIPSENDTVVITSVHTGAGFHVQAKHIIPDSCSAPF